jgi:hypothetical protein
MMGVMAILGTDSTREFGPQPFTTRRLGGSSGTSSSGGCCGVGLSGIKFRNSGSDGQLLIW